MAGIDECKMCNKVNVFTCIQACFNEWIVSHYIVPRFGFAMLHTFLPNNSIHSKTNTRLPNLATTCQRTSTLFDCWSKCNKHTAKEFKSGQSKSIENKTL